MEGPDYVKPGDLLLIDLDRHPEHPRFNSGIVLEQLDKDVVLVLWEDGFRCNTFIWNLWANYTRISSENR